MRDVLVRNTLLCGGTWAMSSFLRRTVVMGVRPRCAEERTDDCCLTCCNLEVCRFEESLERSVSMVLWWRVSGRTRRDCRQSVVATALSI